MPRLSGDKPVIKIHEFSVANIVSEIIAVSEGEAD